MTSGELYYDSLLVTRYKVHQHEGLYLLKPVDVSSCSCFNVNVIALLLCFF